MVDVVAESIAHALIAAAVVEALLRVWRIRTPDLRIRLRLLPIGAAALTAPAFAVLAPARSGDAFRDAWAIFDVQRWADLRVLGIGVDRGALAVLVSLGAALLVVDLVRFRHSRRAALVVGLRVRVGADPPLANEIREVSDALRIRAPDVITLDAREPVLLVTGMRRGVLIVSRGALRALAPPERRAALAHECVHVARRDPLLGWVLLACRVVLCFNPVVQLAARAVVRELEWRADDQAAAISGGSEPLVSALEKLSCAMEEESEPCVARSRMTHVMNGLLRRGKLAAVAARRRRLVAARGAPADTLGAFRVAATAAGLVLLLFFVV